MLRVQLRNIVIALLNEKCVSFSHQIVSSSYTELLICSVGFFNNLYKILLHFDYFETSHELFLLKAYVAYVYYSCLILLV
jgi:hypothetical protein